MASSIDEKTQLDFQHDDPQRNPPETVQVANNDPMPLSNGMNRTESALLSTSSSSNNIFYYKMLNYMHFD